MILDVLSALVNILVHTSKTKTVKSRSVPDTESHTVTSTAPSIGLSRVHKLVEVTWRYEGGLYSDIFFLMSNDDEITWLKDDEWVTTTVAEAEEGYVVFGHPTRGVCGIHSENIIEIKDVE